MHHSTPLTTVGLLLAALASAAPKPQVYWPSVAPAYVPTAAAGSALPVVSPASSSNSGSSYGSSYGTAGSYAPAAYGTTGTYNTPSTYDTTTYDTTNYGTTGAYGATGGSYDTTATDYTTGAVTDTTTYADTAPVYDATSYSPPATGATYNAASYVDPATYDTGYVDPTTYAATENTTPAGYTTTGSLNTAPATYGQSTTPGAPVVYDAANEIQCYNDDGTLAAVVDTETVEIDTYGPNDGTTYKKLRKRGSCFSSTGNYDYYDDPPTLDQVVGPAITRPSLGHYGTYVPADQGLATAINELEADDNDAINEVEGEDDDADDQPYVPNEYNVFGNNANAGAGTGYGNNIAASQVLDTYTEEDVTTEQVVGDSTDEYMAGGMGASMMPAGGYMTGGMMGMNTYNNAPVANAQLQSVAEQVVDYGDYGLIDEADVANILAQQAADLAGNYDVLDRVNANTYAGGQTTSQNLVTDIQPQY
ncbi:hypothetical protein ABW21_db0205542 [Orbilia brochopaga]|nr:hypothetical protein ABW21_db0205542 [Drechslerella brochopaga]